MAKRLFEAAKHQDGRPACLPYVFKDDRLSALLEAARLASGAAGDDDADADVMPLQEYWEGMEVMTGDEELELLEADASLALRGPGGHRRGMPSNKKAPKRGKGRPAKLIPGGPCDCCRIRWSPQWRKPKEDETVLCNACGIYFTRHGKYPEHRARETGGPGNKRWQEGGESEEEGSHDEAFMHAHPVPVRASRSCDSTHVNLSTESPEASGADVLNPSDGTVPKAEPASEAAPATAQQPKPQVTPGHLSDSDPSPSEGSSFTPHTRKRAPACLEPSSPSKFSRPEDALKGPSQTREASLLLQLASSAGRMAGMTGPAHAQPSPEPQQQVLLERRPARRTRKPQDGHQPSMHEQQAKSQSAEPQQQVKAEEPAAAANISQHPSVPGLPPLGTAMPSAGMMQGAMMGMPMGMFTQPMRMLQGTGMEAAGQNMLTAVHQLVNGQLMQHPQHAQQQQHPVFGAMASIATGRTSSTSGVASTNSATPTPGGSVPPVNAPVTAQAQSAPSAPAPNATANGMPPQQMFFVHRPNQRGLPMQFAMPGQPMPGLTFIRPPLPGSAGGQQGQDGQQPQMHHMGAPIFMWAPQMAAMQAQAAQQQQQQQQNSAGGAGEGQLRQGSFGGAGQGQQQLQQGPKLMGMLPGNMAQMLSAGSMGQGGPGAQGSGAPPMFASLMPFPMRAMPMGQMMMMAPNGTLMAAPQHLLKQQQPAPPKAAQNAV